VPEDLSPSSDERAFVLSYKDVAQVLREVKLGSLIFHLAKEIEAVYADSDVRPVKRLGWSTPPNALEIMGCQAADFTCVKLISSIPGPNEDPTVTGTLLCTDKETDQARLVCDAAFLTPLRTAATTAVMMRQAAPGVQSLGIIGAGLEGITHALVLAFLLESITTIQLLDIDSEQAETAVGEIAYLLDREGLRVSRDLDLKVCEDVHDLYRSNALVTATFAEGDVDVLRDTELIPDGLFIAAVGADLETKRELPDQIYQRAKFIADDLQQCLVDGELQYAKGYCCQPGEEESVQDHRGSLAHGRILSAADFLEDPDPFIARSEGITIYDSAGFSGQDLAIARVLLSVLEERGWKRQSWNPTGSHSLVDLLGCGSLTR